MANKPLRDLYQKQVEFEKYQAFCVPRSKLSRVNELRMQDHDDFKRQYWTPCSIVAVWDNQDHDYLYSLVKVTNPPLTKWVLKNPVYANGWPTNTSCPPVLDQNDFYQVPS